MLQWSSDHHPLCYSDHLIIILCVTGMFTTQATDPARCQGGEIGSHSKTSYEDLDCNYWLEDKLTETIFVWPSKEFNKYLIIIFFIDLCFLLKWKTSFTRKPKFIMILDLIQTYWSLITTKTERFYINQNTDSTYFQPQYKYWLLLNLPFSHTSSQKKW